MNEGASPAPERRDPAPGPVAGRFHGLIERFRDPVARSALLLAVFDVVLGVTLVPWVASGGPERWPVRLVVLAVVLFLGVLEVYGYRLISRTIADHRKAIHRERLLSKTGSSLVAARKREDIYRAVEAAFGSLSADQPEARFSMLEGPLEWMTGVAVAGDRADEVRGAGVRLPQIFPEAALEELGRGRVARLPELNLPRARRYLPFEPKSGPVIAIPLLSDREVVGAIVAASDIALPGWCAETLEALAAQTSLALETVGRSEQFQSLVQNSSDVITIVSREGTIRYQSPAVERVFGYPAEALTGSRLTHVLHPEDSIRLMSFLEEAAVEPNASFTLEVRWRHGDGTWRRAETVVNNMLHEPSVRGLVLNTRDVTDRRELESELEHRALHDALTGLANRALFQQSVEQGLARYERGRGALSVVFLDIDSFKDVNESLSHAAGDRLLEQVAVRIRGSVRPYDVAARLGGDEFGLLLEDADAGVASQVCARILQALARPLDLGEREISASASMGIAVASQETTVEELLRNADVAMHIAKGRGQGRFEVFEPDMHTSALERIELAADLRRAVEESEFVLHYQPFVSLKNGEIMGVEALLRWEHPTRGLVLPLEFIPLAEETGLIVPIGRWVLEVACRELKTWLDHGDMGSELTMSVNVSAAQLQHPEFLDQVQWALVQSGVDPAHLLLEITETVLMQDTDETCGRLEQLHKLGVRLAIDDFGTGYSSLSYLTRFPIDVLKIDRSFIGPAGDGETSDLTPVMVSIGRTLGLEIIAEGVESVEQVVHLKQIGCDAAQGFLFARPVPAAEVEAILQLGNLSDRVAAAI